MCRFYLPLCLLTFFNHILCHYEDFPGGYHYHKAFPQEVMVDVINNFGIALLEAHNEGNNNNIALSPYGATSVLIALGEGIRGYAVQEIQEAVRVPQDESVIRVGLRDIHRHLKSYFIPKEGFLAGLTLNNEKVQLNDEYKEILRFYGFDLDSFNSPLYPDIIESSTATLNDSITRTPTTFLLTETTGITEDSIEKATTTEKAELTTKRPVQTRSTEPATTSFTPETTSMDITQRTTNKDVATEEPITSTITTTITTEKLTTMTTSTPAAISTDLTTTVKAETTTIIVTTQEPTTMKEITTQFTTTTKNVDTTITKDTTTQISTSVDDISTQEATTMKDTTTEGTTTERKTTTESSSETTTETKTSEDVTNAENVSTTEETTTEIMSTTQEIQQNKKRNIRSIVDYIIARHYDNHIFKTTPLNNINNYQPEENPSFLIYGTVREPNINFMTYDAVLPIAFLPHLNSVALSFPLDSKEYYLLLILPVDESGIDKLIRDMTHTVSLRDIITSLKYAHVKAVIPSFMLKGYVVLTSSMQKLGIQRIFEPRRTDFSLMTQEKDVYVTNIEQAVTVTIRNYVDEDNLPNYRNLQRARPVLFQADHPFLYFVMDTQIHVALMAGKIVNPLNSRIR